MKNLSENYIVLFERDLLKLKEEISLFKNENDLWNIRAEIKNSPGNLALHLNGNLLYFIGSILGNTGYIRERDKEFSEKNIPIEKIISDIEHVIFVIKNTLANISNDKMNEIFPVEFIGKNVTTAELLLTLYGHFSYHLGQINYYRRLS